MQWVGLFNICYGALGVLAAVHIGRYEAIGVCLWVIACGIVMRSRRFRAMFASLRGKLGSLAKSLFRKGQSNSAQSANSTH